MHQFLFLAIPAGVVALILGLTSLHPSTVKALGGLVLVAMLVSSLIAALVAVLR
jgi:hypothetical protein